MPKPNDISTLGDRVRTARENYPLTQGQLCERAGLSKGFLSEVEHGTRNISVGKLVKLSDVLGVSVEWLIRGVSAKPMRCPYCKGSGRIFE